MGAVYGPAPPSMKAQVSEYGDLVADEQPDPATLMTVPTGVLQLQRPHTPSSSPLRAWSAADQLALDHLGTDELGRTIIVNDEFGALATALARAEPHVWTDSALSRAAIDANLILNGANPLAASQTIFGDDHPEGMFDTVIVRVPKTSALLEYQLNVLRGCVSPATRFIGTGMVRHIHTSTVRSFETLIGATTTSLAKRKARLIHSEPAADQGSTEAPVSAGFVTSDGVAVTELPGTFSAGHVDVGTALLLDVVQTEPEPRAQALIADLGTGNGVVAATLAKRWAQHASFMLLDASDLAIAAATDTWHRNELGDRMSAIAADGFADTADASIDVVVTNPPFHQGHAIDAGLTDRLLRDAARVLTGSGVAYVVVQRHLKLHATMARWFDSVQVISKHPSHVVLKATSPKHL